MWHAPHQGQAADGYHPPLRMRNEPESPCVFAPKEGKPRVTKGKEVDPLHPIRCCLQLQACQTAKSAGSRAT